MSTSYHFYHLWKDIEAPELYIYETPDGDRITASLATKRKQDLKIQYIGYYECRFMGKCKKDS